MELQSNVTSPICMDESTGISYGSPGNWHRIKGLLARGKVILSEVRISMFII